MLIKHKTQDLNYQQDILNLLCQMDTYLSSVSKKKLDSDRFGAKTCVDMDDCKLIVKYKQILIDKANNSKCLCEFLIDDIISRIKQLLNRNQII